MPQAQRLPRLARSHDHERAGLTRLLLAHEKGAEAHISRAIVHTGRRVAEAYAHGGKAAATKAAGGIAVALSRALRPALTGTALDFAHRLTMSPKAAHAWATKSFEDLDGGIARHIAEHTARAVVGISESMAEAIARVIERAVAENLGQEETAKLIVEATSGEIAMARARRIARTEIHFAAMYGQQAAAEASPLAFEKVWLSTEDARTRESHASANGQTVALNSDFTLATARGPVKLRYPGDIDAPPGEVINCRCVCNYTPLPYLKPDEPSEVDYTELPGDDAPEADTSPAVDEQQPGTPEIVQAPGQEPRPAPEPLDESEPAEPELVQEPVRDLNERPYERAAVTLYASGDELNLDPDGTPRTGSVVKLVGPNDFYRSPDAPEVDRSIAHLAGGVILRPGTWFRRPQLWQITIPAGAAFPEGLVSEGGNGLTINSGIGRFGLVELRVQKVTNVTWGTVAPKDYVEISDAYTVRQIEASIERIAAHAPDDTAERIATALGVQMLGLNELDDADVAPRSVIRALRDTPWTKQALARYLRRLLDGAIRDEPEPGEPATDTRIIVVEAVADIAAAIIEETP